MAIADITIREELRPAVVTHKRPVLDEDGFTTYMEVTEEPAMVHTVRLAAQGRFVVEYQDGRCGAVEPQNVRFTDGIRDEDDA